MKMRENGIDAKQTKTVTKIMVYLIYKCSEAFFDWSICKILFSDWSIRLWWGPDWLW